MKKIRYYPDDKNFEITLKTRAKFMRSHQTFCEKIVWNAIRNNQLGVKFRRQFIISKYIVDFVCIEKNLIIEIDGISHIGNEIEDQYRENDLYNLGFRILRFTDDEVTGNGNRVVDKIKEYVNI